MSSYLFNKARDLKEALQVADVERTTSDLMCLGKRLEQKNTSMKCYVGYETIPSDGQWHPLPSYQVNDQLLKYQVDGEVGIEFAYHGADNQYYARVKKDHQLSQEVTINFLFNSPNPSTMLSTNEIDPLQAMFVNEFTAGELILEKAKPNGRAYLNAIMEQKKGSCRHRTIAFKAIMDEKKIPVRVINNECHQFAEIKIGDHWRRYDLGGYPAKINIAEKAKINPSQPKDASAPNVASEIDDLGVEASLVQLTHHFKNRRPEASAITTYLDEPGVKLLIETQAEQESLEALIHLYKVAKEKQQPIFFVESPKDLYCSAQWIQKAKDSNVGEIKDGPGGPLYEFLVGQPHRTPAPTILINYDNFKPNHSF